MVQVLRRGPTRGQLTSQLLGQSIGEGLGATIGDYYANKALEEVLADKALADASPLERMGALQKRLGIHGERGQRVLSARMAVEQQDAEQRAAQNKPAPGGLSGQPVPPEVQQATQAVLESNPGAGADELLLEMDKQGIPRAYSNAFVESRRRQDDSDAKTLSAGSESDKEILQQYNAWRRDAMVLDEMGRLAERDLPKPLAVSVLNKLGIPIAVLDNPDAEEFDKLSQGLLNNIQSTFGARILKVEVDNFLRTIPGLLNSAEGRRRLIKQWQTLNNSKKVVYDAYREIRSANPKRLPDDWRLQVQDKADERLDELAADFAATGQQPLDVQPPRPQFAGQPITEDIVIKYLDAAGGDTAKAKQMAAKDGYKF